LQVDNCFLLLPFSGAKFTQQPTNQPEGQQQEEQSQQDEQDERRRRGGHVAEFAGIVVEALANHVRAVLRIGHASLGWNGICKWIDQSMIKRKRKENDTNPVLMASGTQFAGTEAALFRCWGKS
jgi:hypothetical protein